MGSASVCWNCAVYIEVKLRGSLGLCPTCDFHISTICKMLEGYDTGRRPIMALTAQVNLYINRYYSRVLMFNSELRLYTKLREILRSNYDILGRCGRLYCCKGDINGI